MTDLEIVKRCAEKMGYQVREASGLLWIGVDEYNPLTNSAQTFELVEQFGLWIEQEKGKPCAVYIETAVTVYDPDLHRAICLCVAGMPCPLPF